MYLIVGKFSVIRAPPAVEVRESQKYAKATFKKSIVPRNLQKHPGNIIENHGILSSQKNVNPEFLICGMCQIRQFRAKSTDHKGDPHLVSCTGSIMCTD